MRISNLLHSYNGGLKITSLGFIASSLKCWFNFQVVFDTLYGTNTNPKLKQLVLNFALSMVRK